MELYPTEGTYPLQNEGPKDFFPPVCNQFHFDPTLMIKHTLPEQNYSIPLPLGPRPWTKICLEYVNSTTNEPAPNTDPNIAFPAGGFFQDPNRYLASVDSESQLRRLNQPLRKCDAGQYEPNNKGDMFNNRILVSSNPTRTSQIPDIAMPKAVITAGPYKCREDADSVNTAVSNKTFFNATKQERYYIKTNDPRNLKTYPNIMDK
uniref:Uncharacterized protein n=1 Tax=viral metagenome TaxID=1070528 RepID=A0A6C0D9T5_9ZZZZ